MKISFLQPNLFVANPFVDRFNEGGPFLMSLILICLVLSIYFIVKAGRSLKKPVDLFRKFVSLCAETGLLGLVIGVFGSVIGMIEAFDAIESFDDPASTGMMAAGLKVSFLTMVFGTFTFIISRIAIIVLKWLRVGDMAGEKV